MTKNPTSLNRRQALAGAGAAAGALAIAGPALAALPKHDRLAMLIERYYAEVDVFNATHHPTDAEINAHSEETYDKTVVEMTGVPATTAAGALAALAFIEREKIDTDYPCEFDDMIQSLLQAVRGYIEHGVQS